jgi:tetratricopeptide (TPR) repeat protein
MGSEVQLWNAADLTRIGSRIRTAGTVTRMAFDSQGGALLVASNTDEGPRLSIWDAGSGCRLSPPIELPAPAYRLACHPDGRSVAIADRMAGGVWEVPLPQVWDADATESAQRVEAWAGCTLTEQGDVEPLEAAGWIAQIAKVEFPESRSEPDDAGSVLTDWRESDAYRIIEDETRSDEEKLAALDPFIEQQPDLWPARMARSTIRLRQGRLDEAAEDLEAAARQNREEVLDTLRRRLTNAMRSSLGPTLRTSFNPTFGPSGPEDSERFRDQYLWNCERILALEPNEPTTLLLRTLALVEADRFDEAEAALEAAVKAGPEDLVVENLRAHAATVSGSNSRGRGLPLSGVRSDAAKRPAWLLGRLIEMRPDDWRLLVARARLALREERMDDALADIDRAAELGPAEEIAGQLTFTRRGLLVRTAEEGESPLEWMREEMRLHNKILELDPNHTTALRMLGELHGRCADWEKAAERYTRLVELEPESYSWRYRLAPLLVRTDQNQRCRDLLRDRVFPTLPLADASADDKGRLYIQALRNSLDNPDVSAERRPFNQSYLGCAYLRSGQHAEAIEWLEKSIEPEGINPRLRIRGLSMLAMAHQESGKAAKARELLDQADELYAAEGPKFGVDDGHPNWYDWLICELLLEEAKEKIVVEEEQDHATPTQEKSASENP